ncbi:hypothetical protein GGX14DRAFT_414525 [Mycena pura]|uniref:DUF302 domain-containing protein n=1 Tax=Mycena pura TaxID=153505 RepID=A0AAD6YTJ5_9AGAR|nr:hypothetical protein GGX14DRAFT_414525 [Mycena pura]
MSKTITSHMLQLVTFTTSLPISQVMSRLDDQVAKGSPAITAGWATATREEFEKGINDKVGPSGFMFFDEYNYGRFLQLYTNSPRVHVYVVGNPIFAQTMLQHDLRAACNVPLRLLLIEKADGVGTDVVYHLPSSVIALGDDAKLKAAAEVIDKKLESLVESITAP